jgi:hypothetical protein
VFSEPQDPHTCANHYADELLMGRVPDDVTEILVIADTMAQDLRRYKEVERIRDFIERSLWLKALGEPEPHMASVREAIDRSWTEDMHKLRKRGASRIFDVHTLAVWSDAQTAPTFASPAENDFDVPSAKDPTSTWGVVYARLRIANLGQMPIAGVVLSFPIDDPAWKARLGPRLAIPAAECPWRPYLPLEPGQISEVLCSFGTLRDRMAPLKEAIQKAPPPLSTDYPPSTPEVSFAIADHAVPYIPYNLLTQGGDPEFERAAIDRTAAVCSQGASEWSTDALRILSYILLPGLIGAVLGWRSTR